MKKGKVIIVNKKKGFIAVKIKDGEISVIELLGGHEVGMDDIISGNLEFIGSGKLVNESRNEKMSVFIQDVSCTKSDAKNLME